MSKQWKKSLEQSDILSDETPFNGSYIDQKVSNISGGTPWDQFTFEFISVSGGGSTTINGSGVVIIIMPDDHSGASDQAKYSLDIDGTNVINDHMLNENGSDSYTNNMVLMPFSSSFTLIDTENWQPIGAVYGLE